MKNLFFVIIIILTAAFGGCMGDYSCTEVCENINELNCPGDFSYSGCLDSCSDGTVKDQDELNCQGESESCDNLAKCTAEFQKK